MKYLCLAPLLFFGGAIFAQSEITAVSVTHTSFIKGNPSIHSKEIDYKMLAWPKQTNLISISDESGQFQKTYGLNEDGKTISSGFMPVAYFRPNDNLIVINAEGIRKKDSLNPYGARDMPSAILLGTINNFVSKLKIGGR